MMHRLGLITEGVVNPPEPIVSVSARCCVFQFGCVLDRFS